MHRTRLSLYYLAGYLIPTGLGLMFAPRWMLAMLFTRGEYGEVMPSFAGVLMVGLGIIVSWLIATRSERLYPATLAVRSVIFLWTLRLYLVSGDPLFAVILGVVGFGMALTGACYLTEKGKTAAA